MLITSYDAVIVGSGPNGLAAAITLARADWAVLLIEAHAAVGGGLRSEELTLPGFVHDVCAAVHPFGVGSGFFRELPLGDHGLEWVDPPAPVAHPMDDGSAVVVERSVEETAAQLGCDAHAYRRLAHRLVEDHKKLLHTFLGPLRLPRHPWTAARFGLPALLPATTLAKRRFREPPARAVFAGMAAHSILPLEKRPTAAFGLILTMLAHAVGWPIVRGGSGRLAEAMASYLQSLGGKIQTGRHVASLAELPAARAYLLDVTPRQLVNMAEGQLSASYRRQLERYRHGPGVCKVDFALDGPIPWQAEECRRAGTVHVGGTSEEIAASEQAVWRGEHPNKPFVLLAQQSLFDATRAPAGKHTAWAYCHVPHGSDVDVTQHIVAQIERFAPGFKERILAHNTRTAMQMEQYNPNYVGGDITGGVQDLRQLFTRPTVRLAPYSTSLPGIYLCSSATPPGGGVHGLCGYHAAQAVLRAGE